MTYEKEPIKGKKLARIQRKRNTPPNELDLIMEKHSFGRILWSVTKVFWKRFNAELAWTLVAALATILIVRE